MPKTSTELFSIVYVSTRSHRVTDGQVVELVLLALRRNRVAGITGCLWFGSGRFFQVIEGERPVVEATFDRIRRDERHCDLLILKREPVLQRQFERWSLASIRGDESDQIDALIAQHADDGHRHLAQRDDSLLTRVISVIVQKLRNEPTLANTAQPRC